MAILTAKENWTRNVGYQVDDGRRVYVRTWVFTTDDRNTGAVTILNYCINSINAFFQPCVDPDGTTDAGAVLTHIDPQQHAENPFLWTVRFTFDSSAIVPAYASKNPLHRPARISYAGTQFQRAMVADLNNKACLFSNGLPIDPPLMIDDSRLTIVAQRNELIFDAQQAFLYKDVVNSDVFSIGNLSCPAGTVKMSMPSGQDMYENGVSYFNVTRQFHVRPEGWNDPILDQGYHELINAAPNNEVQTLSMGGTPAGGSFVLSMLGQKAAPLSWNATAGAVQTVLNNLSTLADPNGGVSTAGGPLPGTAVVITFQNGRGNRPQALIQTDGSGLTGTNPTVTVARTTAGSTGGNVLSRIFVSGQPTPIPMLLNGQGASKQVVPLSGTCTVSGNLITRTSGPAFTGMTGTFSVDGRDFTIAQVQDQNTLRLTSEPTPTAIPPAVWYFQATGLSGPTYLYFQRYKALPFSVFNLPNAVQ